MDDGGQKNTHVADLTPWSAEGWLNAYHAVAVIVALCGGPSFREHGLGERQGGCILQEVASVAELAGTQHEA